MEPASHAPEESKLGIFPGWGGTIRLARVGGGIAHQSASPGTPIIMKHIAQMKQLATTGRGFHQEK